MASSVSVAHSGFPKVHVLFFYCDQQQRDRDWWAGRYLRKCKESQSSGAQLWVTFPCLTIFLFSRLPSPSSHLWTLQDSLTRVPEQCLPVCLPQAVPQNSSILTHLSWSSAFHFHYPRATGCPPRCLDALTGVPEAMAADSSIPSHTDGWSSCPPRTGMDQQGGAFRICIHEL